MRISKIIILLLFGLKSYSQVYFPSNDSTEWDSISPLSFDYCQQNIDSLYNFLDVITLKHHPIKRWKNCFRTILQWSF